MSDPVTHTPEQDRKAAAAMLYGLMWSDDLYRPGAPFSYVEIWEKLADSFLASDWLRDFVAAAVRQAHDEDVAIARSHAEPCKVCTLCVKHLRSPQQIAMDIAAAMEQHRHEIENS